MLLILPGFYNELKVVRYELPAEGMARPVRIALVTDLEEGNEALQMMVERFMRVSPYPVRLVNLHDFPFAGGCLGCFHCASDGTCIYQDGFDRFLRENIQEADATVYAYTIRDHSMGYRFKLYNQCDKEDWEAAANTGADFFAMSDIGGMEYSVRDFSYYANALNKTNRSAEAIQAFEKAMELFPNDNTIRKQMFNIYNANKDYVNAAKLCQSIVDGGDYSTADLYNLANSYRRVASVAQDATIKLDAIMRARNAINELIQKEPNELAYMYMASQIDVLEDTNEKTGSAVNSYLRLLSAADKNPSDANATAYYKSAYAYLGYYYMTSGDNVKAKDYFTKYLKYDPNNENLRKVVEGL